MVLGSLPVPGPPRLVRAPDPAARVPLRGPGLAPAEAPGASARPGVRRLRAVGPVGLGQRHVGLRRPLHDRAPPPRWHGGRGACLLPRHPHRPPPPPRVGAQRHRRKPPPAARPQPGRPLMAIYPVLAVVAAALVVVVELRVLRTGIFRQPAY